jgi:chromosome segregation ATPase
VLRAEVERLAADTKAVAQEMAERAEDIKVFQDKQVQQEAELTGLAAWAGELRAEGAELTASLGGAERLLADCGAERERVRARLAQGRAELGRRRGRAWRGRAWRGSSLAW